MKSSVWITALAVAILVLGGIFFLKSGPETVTASQITIEVPVSVDLVREEKISSTLSLVGTILANNDVNLVSQAQGEVVAVYHEVGDFVASGTVIAQVDDDLKRSALAAAEVNQQKCKRDLERNEALYQENSISALQLDAARLAYQSADNQLDIARRQLKDTRLTTPIAGTVSARMVEIGTMVTPGMSVANIVDISTLRVRVNVNERDAFRIKTGEKVEITTDIYPKVKFEGRIENISSKADESHTYLAEIRMNNDKTYPLRAGLFARVAFRTSESAPTLVISRSSLLGSVKDAQVYQVENGTAILRSIVVGQESRDLLEVLDGVHVGDTIVTNGHNNLTDNSPVAIIR
jgi:RND family efflux transporter MFP subunit